MNNHLEAGDLVAITRDLKNPNHPDAPLSAGVLGIVDRIGTFVRIEIGWDTYVHVRPEVLTVVEKGFVEGPAPAVAGLELWDLWAEAARKAHELDVRLTGLWSAGAGHQDHPGIS